MENGSGKSTLARIVAGMIQPDEGHIVVDGQDVRFANPAAAIALGIVMISQELTLAPTLTVAENAAAGRLPEPSLGLMDWVKLTRCGSRPGPPRCACVATARVADLSVEIRQEVEIARALLPMRA